MNKDIKYNRNVLFVDDEELILDKIKRKLKNCNFKLFFAQTGHHALRILDKKDIAVVVIDLSMPEFTGIELLKIINNEYSDLVKIIFSIYTDVGLISSVSGQEIYQYIPKNRVNKEQGYKLEIIPIISNAVEKYNLVYENKLLKKELKKQRINSEE